MTKAYLTSKKGKITEISIYKYAFINQVRYSPFTKKRYLTRLKQKLGDVLFDINEKTFCSLKPISTPSMHTRLIYEKSIKIPILNTQEASFLISKLIGIELNKHFKSFNKNVFVVNTFNCGPFNLLKAIEFNVEVFPDGEYLVHLLPISKITSSSSLSIDYLNRLRSSCQANQNVETLLFNVFDSEKFKRVSLDFMAKDFETRAKSLINSNINYYATFNY